MPSRTVGGGRGRRHLGNLMPASPGGTRDASNLDFIDLIVTAERVPALQRSARNWRLSTGLSMIGWLAAALLLI